MLSEVVEGVSSSSPLLSSPQVQSSRVGVPGLPLAAGPEGAAAGDD